MDFIPTPISLAGTMRRMAASTSVLVLADFSELLVLFSELPDAVLEAPSPLPLLLLAEAASELPAGLDDDSGTEFLRA